MSSVLCLAHEDRDTKATGSPAVALSVTAKGAVGMNLLRAAYDNGEGQLGLMDAEIQKLEGKLVDVRRDRLFTQLVLDIAKEYHAGVEQPSGNYSIGCTLRLNE